MRFKFRDDFGFEYSISFFLCIPSIVVTGTYGNTMCFVSTDFCFEVAANGTHQYACTAISATKSGASVWWMAKEYRTKLMENKPTTKPISFVFLTGLCTFWLCTLSSRNPFVYSTPHYAALMVGWTRSPLIHRRSHATRLPIQSHNTDQGLTHCDNLWLRH